MARFHTWESGPGTELFARMIQVVTYQSMNSQRPTPIPQARQLRKQMTDAELRLWQLLRKKQILGLRFRKQSPIGPYIADFVCLERKLIIEVDGGQHKDQLSYDEQRTGWLESRGFKVVRFWNTDVLNNAEGVLETIYRMLK